MLTCPHCGSLAATGHEVRGVYDGVLFWSCNDCCLAWSRNWSGYGRRQQIADEMVADHNALMERATTAGRAAGKDALKDPLPITSRLFDPASA